MNIPVRELITRLNLRAEAAKQSIRREYLKRGTKFQSFVKFHPDPTISALADRIDRIGGKKEVYNILISRIEYELKIALYGLQTIENAADNIADIAESALDAEYDEDLTVKIRGPELLEKAKDRLIDNIAKYGGDYPVYVFANMTIETGIGEYKEVKVIEDPGLAKKLASPDDMDEYLAGARRRLVTYMYRDATLFHMDFEIEGRKHMNPRIIRVANYKFENCVLRVIRKFTTPTVLKSIYKKHPELIPGIREYVPIDHDIIESIATRAKLCLKFYTPIGLKLDVPWHSINDTAHRKIINIKIENGHATIADKRIKVTNIEYHSADIPFKKPDEPTIVDHFTIDKTCYYYIDLQNGIYTLHKTFRPSSFTNVPGDDTSSEYTFCTSQQMIQAKQFKAEFNLTPIYDPIIRKIVKSAEHFIGRKALSQLDLSKNYVQFDSNGNYVSYETVPEYKGFPSNKLYPVKLEYANPANAAFYILSNIEGAPESFNQLYEYSSGPITLPAPVYDYLISEGSTIHVVFVLEAPHQEISIVDYVDRFHKRESAGEEKTPHKKLRNSLIGRCITGGIKEFDRVVVEYDNTSEQDRLMLECQTHNIDYCDRGTFITAHLPKKTSGIFHFHAYILGYASIKVMRKWMELEYSGRTVKAFCVDALVVEGNDAPYNNYIIGDWKIEPIKSHYLDCIPKSDCDFPEREQVPIPILNDLPIPTRKVVIAAPGIGKSFRYLSQPYHDQIAAAPTHKLVNSQKTLFPNTHTGHMLFQMLMEEDYMVTNLRNQSKIPRSHAVTIIDEFTKYDQNEMDMILRRGANTTFILTGDFEQITTDNHNFGAVTLEYLQSNGFAVEYMARNPSDSEHHRHSFEYGTRLDNLRGRTPRQQKTMILNDPTWTHIDDITGLIDVDTKIIVGDHIRAGYFNELAKLQLTGLFPVVTKAVQGSPKEYSLQPTNSPLIWWGRQKMTDKCPKDKKYEPFLAVTADCIQGETIESTLIIDIEHLDRAGTLYTAITRTRTPDNTYIYC